MTVHFVNRTSWRKWLMTNHKTSEEVWLTVPKKAAGKGSYRDYYNEALEEAICFGWVDSRIRRIDETKSMIRFTPRRSSNWSKYNIERAMRLISEGKMTFAGLQVFPRNSSSRWKRRVVQKSG